MATATLVLYRDVLRRDDNFGLRLDRYFETGYGLGKTTLVSNAFLNMLIQMGIAVVGAIIGCAIIWFSVVEPIAVHVFRLEIE